MGEKLLGKPVADIIYEDIDYYIERLDLHPKCNVIYDNLDNGSALYLDAICKRAEEHGIEINRIYMDPNSDSADCFQFIASLKKNVEASNFLLRPCKNNYLRQFFAGCIDMYSDIDCVTDERFEKSFLYPNYLPCTCKAVIKLLDHYNIFPEGKTVTILGRSKAVGLPLVNAFINRDATVTSCNSYTTKENLTNCISNSDIVISCMGNPNILTRDMLKYNDKKSFTFIDVSTNVVDGITQGDISDEIKENMTDYYTSPNNGIGIVTTAVLLDEIVENCIEYEVG